MSFSAIITDPHQPDAMPMWESFDHADLDDTLQAAQAHIHATQRGDRIVREGHGVYAVCTGPAPSTRVATVVITPTDDHHVTSADGDQLDVAIQMRQLASRYERSGAIDYAQALRRQAAQCLADTTIEPYLQIVRSAGKNR